MVVIGIDLSTTAVKAIAWDAAGTAVAEGRASLAISQPRAGVYEQDPRDWEAAIATALRIVLETVPAGRVAALAIANQRETIAVVDAAGQPLRPALLWLDERRKTVAARLRDRIGAARLHALTGKPPDWAPAVFSLAWIAEAEPDLFRRIARVHEPHSHAVAWLTGSFVTSWASADPLGCFDIHRHVWSEPVLDALPLDPACLPEARAPGTILGTVTAAAAAVTGLAPGTPVVAGGGDGQAAAPGAGIAGPGLSYLNLGTAVVAGVHDATARIDPAFRTLCAVGPGHILETSLRSGTLLVDWMLRRLFGVDPGRDPGIFTRLEQEAADVPAGAGGLLLLPYWNAVMNPHWDPDARGCLLGLRPEHGQAHVFRALLEGIALEQALATDRVAAATAIPVAGFVAMGGGSASGLWCRIIADISGRPVLRPRTAEASSLGAGIIAAVGAGWYPDVPAAVAAMTATTPVAEPDPGQTRRYADLRGIYGDLYPTLRSLFPRLGAFSL